MTPRLGRWPLLSLVAALALVACGPNQATSTPGPSPTTLQQPTIDPPSPTPGQTITSNVDIDPSLLAILPAEVDGLPVTENADGEAATLGDPLLEQVGSAFAAGFAIDLVTSEFVYAVVVRLLPDAVDDGIFRDWRDSYDEGACSQAGGVAGKAETEIDGRTVYIGTCAGGLRTYHVWLEAEGILVSASAVGEERRLGEDLVENLRP